jgi:hypothetical protein
MLCHHCWLEDFRLSRLRLFDMPRLLVLQYPVRCRNCAQRAYTSFPSALKISRADKIRHHSAHRSK